MAYAKWTRQEEDWLKRAKRHSAKLSKEICGLYFQHKIGYAVVADWQKTQLILSKVEPPNDPYLVIAMVRLEDLTVNVKKLKGES